jgi:hypothetical protein
MEHKYPYIPKEYYAAVMFACKIIREKKSFNRGINTAAKYYSVDRDELAKHVRARQAAGQKGSKREKYKYYAIAFFVAGDHYVDYQRPFREPICFEVVKATSLKNAKNQIRNKYGNYRYGPYAFISKDKECPTEESARETLREWESE